MHNILTQSGISLKLVRLINVCLNETYIRVSVGKRLFNRFPVKNGLKQGYALSPLFFKFALQYAIMRVQANQEGMKSSGTHQLLIYADDANMLGGSIRSIRNKHRCFSNC